MKQVLIGNFEENPQDVARSCFVGVAWIFSSGMEVPILNQHIISCHDSFWLNTLKGTA